MNVSFIVATLGQREDELRRLLDSLTKQTYKDFEVIFITQIEHASVERIMKDFEGLRFKHVKIERKGLSIARNAGIKEAEGDICILADDDGWYNAEAVEKIVGKFEANPQISVLMTQIYDKDQNVPYKNYPSKEAIINQKIKLMSKTSSEIALRRSRLKDCQFDERFGLGAEFVCGEEVDFLLRNYKRNTYLYTPIVTMYHPKKMCRDSNKQVIAKGALYKKQFNLAVSLLVLMRDLIMKKQNNFKYFFEGYNEYRKREN